MAADIFKNLKIVELASVLAGPSVGMFFAELGAEVIKFENALTNGDVTRTWKLTSEKKEDISAYYASINYKKKHILVNYNLQEDITQVQKALEKADIVICNFKQGLAEKFALDYKTLSKSNPKLIYAQLNGFAEDSFRVAFDVVLQAECGYMYMNGDAKSPPTKMPLALMDILAAHQMKEGILSAIIKRYQTNIGSYVSCSLEKSAIASLANQASNYLMANHIPQRIGSLHPNIAPYGEVFTTHDNQFVVLAIGSDRQFEKLCEFLNLTIHKEEKYNTNKARVKNRSTLQAFLSDEILKYNSEELLNHCNKMQVPIGKVKDMKAVFESSVAQSMILTEEIEGQLTKRVSSVAFTID
jgi:crotonobetainyl-CoA:carnitine CoA-transferase CaiB-like acyl-CoA transferase